MPSWKFDNLDDAKKLVSGERMDSSKIGADPVALTLAPNLSFDLAGAKLTLNPTGNLSVAVLNDEQDKDADAVIVKDDAETPGGTLPPHCRLKDGPWRRSLPLTRESIRGGRPRRPAARVPPRQSRRR